MARKSGENVGNEDAYLEPTSLTRSGREAGAWVYLDAHTLKAALKEAGIDPETPVGDLEAIRYVLRKGGKDAQVLLKIHVRKAPAAEVACPVCDAQIAASTVRGGRMPEHTTLRTGTVCSGSGMEVA